MLDIYIKEIKKHPPISREEERELIAKAKEGNRKAYNKVMNSNLRFVFQIAKSYKDNGIDLDDLISEGNLGLIKAYTRFDLSKNVKFISYAV